MTKIAVLGTGSIGMRHLRIFSALPGVEVTAIPVRAERIDDLNAEGFRAVADLDDLRGLDGVLVATNTGRHLQDARLALECGAHVLVEKPLASSSGGVRSLLNFAAAHKKGLFVGCCLRFHDSLLAFREHLAEVGPFYAVEISCRSYLPDWRAGYDYRSGYAANPQEGGVLRDLIHEIDYALWLFGMPESVYCQFANSGQLGIPTEEQASLLWRSDQGVQVSIQLDYLTRNPVRRMAAYGVNGQLGVDLIGQTVTVQKTAALPETFDLKGAKDKMYFDQARAFLRAIDRDDSMQLASGLEGLNALAVCDAARRSDRSQNADKVIL